MIIGIDGNEANVKNRVGSGQYAFELLHQFAGMDGTNSFVVYLKEAPLADLPKESSHFKYLVFGPKKLWTQFALPIKLTIAKHRPDVFFSMAHYGPRFSRVPYVVTIHDLSYLHFPQMFRKSDLYQLTSWTKYSIRHSARVIAVSHTTKDDIVKNYGIDPAKVTVTYEGYDKDRFKPQSKPKGNYIIFVGTLQPRKNLERLIEAFSLLITPGVGSGRRLENTPGVGPNNLKLVICGKKGWLFDSIFEKVKQMNLENRVIFTDYVPDDDLPSLISGAKAYILPSLWEGFGIPVIEAQACGVPVVVSNTSSLPEIVGESAILINPESIDSIAAGLKKVLTDEKLRKSLVKAGFANIKRFSWQKCARLTLAILQKVAAAS